MQRITTEVIFKYTFLFDNNKEKYYISPLFPVMFTLCRREARVEFLNTKWFLYTITHKRGNTHTTPLISRLPSSKHRFSHLSFIFIYTERYINNKKDFPDKVIEKVLMLFNFTAWKDFLTKPSKPTYDHTQKIYIIYI